MTNEGYIISLRGEINIKVERFQCSLCFSMNVAYSVCHSRSAYNNIFEHCLFIIISSARIGKKVEGGGGIGMEKETLFNAYPPFNQNCY